MTEEEIALSNSYTRKVRKKEETTPAEKRAWSLRVSAMQRAKKERDPAAYIAETRARTVRANANGANARRQARANDKRRAVIDAIKRHAGCVDCGRKDLPPECLDFDHLPGQAKAFQIGMHMRLGPERILDEIAKCEVVCANCHRSRTRRRRGKKPTVAPEREYLDHSGNRIDFWQMAVDRGLLPAAEERP